MDSGISRSARRWAVVGNGLGLLLILALVYEKGIIGSSGWLIGGVVASTLLVLATFYIFQVRTGLWRLVHARAEKLDERELGITLDSLNDAYAIFAVLMILLLGFAVFVRQPSDALFSMLKLLALLTIYIAHSLPAAVIAWKAERVD